MGWMCKYPRSLSLRRNSLFHTIFQSFLTKLSPVVSSGNLLDDTPPIGFLPFSILLPILPVFPGITSQINSLHVSESASEGNQIRSLLFLRKTCLVGYALGSSLSMKQQIYQMGPCLSNSSQCSAPLLPESLHLLEWLLAGLHRRAAQPRPAWSC